MGTVLRDTIFSENWIIRTVPMILYVTAALSRYIIAGAVVFRIRITTACEQADALIEYYDALGGFDILLFHCRFLHCFYLMMVFFPWWI